MNEILLLVEDEPILRITKKAELEKYGYSVFISGSGEDAVEIAMNNESIALILMDIDLGRGIDGTEAAQKILEIRDIPIVFLSSHTERDVVSKTEKITSYGYVVKNSGIVVLDASIKMALKLFSAKLKEKTKEKEIEKERFFLRQYLKITEILIIALDRKGNITLANPKCCKTLGYSEEELAGSNWFEKYLDSDDLLRVKETFNRIITGNLDPVEYYENPVICKDGSKRLIEWHNSILYDQENNIIGLLSSGLDITERKEMELALKESKFRFDMAMQASRDGLFDWNLVTRQIYYSPGWKKMLGYKEEELPNDFSVWETLTKESDVKRSWEKLQKLINREIDRFEIEFKMKHKEGHWVDILSRADAVFDDHGKAVRVVGTHVDISRRKKAEAEKEKILKENKAFMRDMNHRIKNNFMMVESLIKLKQRNSGGETDLNDLLSRVQVFEMIHETLFENEIAASSEVDMLRFLPKIIAGLEKSSFIPIKIDHQIDSVILPSRKAANLGLIINEIITNAVRHGETQTLEQLLVRIDLKYDSARRKCTLTIANPKGKPFPEEVNIHKPSTMGLQLIQSFLSGLEGSMELKRKPELVFKILFNLGQNPTS